MNLINPNDKYPSHKIQRKRLRSWTVEICPLMNWMHMNFWGHIPRKAEKLSSFHCIESCNQQEERGERVNCAFGTNTLKQRKLI